MKKFSKSKTTVTNEEAVENLSDKPSSSNASVFTYFSFLFKKYLTTPTTYAGYLIPLMLIIGLATLLPADAALMGIISISVQIHIYTLYGNTYFNTKTSTLQRNLDMIPLSKVGQQAATFLFIFLATTIYIIFTMVLLFVLQFIPGFISGVIVTPIPGEPVPNPNAGLINFGTTLNNWMAFIYTCALTIIVSFSVAYFFGEVFKDMKIYMIACMTYVMLSVLFTGLLAASFSLKVQVSPTQVVMTRMPQGANVVIPGTEMPIKYFHTKQEYIPSNLAALENVGGFDTTQFSPEGLQDLLSQWQQPSFLSVMGYAMPHSPVHAFGYQTMSQWATQQGTVNDQAPLAIKWFNTYSSEMYYILIAPYVWVIGLPIIAHLLNKTVITR